VPSSDPEQRFQDILNNIARIERHVVERDLAPLKAAVEQALQRMEARTGQDD
jgi:hypothetical protein